MSAKSSPVALSPERLNGIVQGALPGVAPAVPGRLALRDDSRFVRDNLCRRRDSDLNLNDFVCHVL